MMDKERENDRTFEDLFREKLSNYEIDVPSDLWQSIEGRLPRRNVVPFRRKVMYSSVAAVLLLLLGITGSIYILEEEDDVVKAVSSVEKETSVKQHFLKDEVQELFDNRYEGVADAAARSFKENTAQNFAVQTVAIAEPKMAEIAALSDEKSVDAVEKEVLAENPEEKPEVEKTSETNKQRLPQGYVSSTREKGVANRTVKEQVKAKSKNSGWTFGVGAGGFAGRHGDAVNDYRLQSQRYLDMQIAMLNAASYNSNTSPAKTDIKHHIPVSFGLTVSRHLNDRFAIQSGLTYTFLTSDWTTNGTYRGDTRQRLHFLGIPLSVIYNIAEWNRLKFYVSAGAMTEVNLAGKVHTELYGGDEFIQAFDEDRRMKEWLWSVNARLGLNYPLVGALAVYGEVGADYYFDNGSSIETIRSERPFNVSLQFGLRFGL